MTDSIRRCLEQAASLLIGDGARLDAELLLAYVLQKPRSYLYTWPDQPLTESQYQQYVRLLQQCASGKPLAYITGEREFWSMSLQVNEHTLIPRPETEQLVDAVLADFADVPDCTVWDAGTGSGAIALALKKEKPHWQLMASDISHGALTMAANNAQQWHLPVQFVHASWLDCVAASSLDILVSNPPYIAPGDPHLAALHYEPLSALVAADQGMADIQHLCQQAQTVLKPGGRFYVEHGYDQQQTVQQAFADAGLINVTCHRDYAGLPRFTSGVRP